MVLFTELSYGLDAYQVPLHLRVDAPTLRHCTSGRVDPGGTDPYVGCYDLPKVGVSTWQHRDLSHAIAVSGAPIKVIDTHYSLFSTCA
jgi:hypothetical protein